MGGPSFPRGRVSADPAAEAGARHTVHDKHTLWTASACFQSKDFQTVLNKVFRKFACRSAGQVIASSMGFVVFWVGSQSASLSQDAVWLNQNNAGLYIIQ